uniref:Endothelin-converting enzyme 2 n=1 Tax=Anthurium amnicola TaxID=1678845 RepID=A0A1D1YMH8_9ARAE
MTLGGAAATATHAYGEASYWDQRYRQDAGPFDWYQKYGPLAPLLDLYLRRRHRALLVGCGNSALGEEMVNDGYEDIVNIDISSVVIEAMQKKFQDHPEMKYITMDVRDMSVFESGSFDAVIDKGTLDSLMCGHNAQENATKMLEEVDRILKDKGLYILITYGDPKYRLYLLKSVCCWNVNLHVIDRPDKVPEDQTWDLIKPIPLNEDGSLATSVLGSKLEIHYIYVCTKDESLRSSVNEMTGGHV